jgi:ribosomal protein S18 acetylase RimI-like enzyme
MTLLGSSLFSRVMEGDRDELSLLRFESVEARHLGALTELFERNSMPAVTSSFDPFPLTAREAQRIALEPHKDAYFVAVRAGRPVGLSMLRGFDEGYEIPSFGIFVDHEAHGQGVGRALTAWTVGAAQGLGCPSVRLTVYSTNSVALGLYASLGFVEQRRRSVDRGAGDEEKIVMCLSLGG